MLKLNFLRVAGLFLLCAPLTFLATDGLAKGKNDKKKKGEKKGEKAADGGGSGYAAPYGMAGCGLGSLVIHEDTMVMQTFAATLNATGYQLSAISITHSSNCTSGKEEAAVMEQEVFVAANLRALESDVSSGGGDYAHAFADVLGCAGDGNYSEFLEVSRSNYEDIFGDNDPQVVYARYIQALRGSNKLVNGCERMVFKS